MTFVTFLKVYVCMYVRRMCFLKDVCKLNNYSKQISLFCFVFVSNWCGAPSFRLGNNLPRHRRFCSGTVNQLGIVLTSQSRVFKNEIGNFSRFFEAEIHLTIV